MEASAAATEVVGHDVVRARLWEALAKDSLHHALLFEGPRGVGRERVAVRLAMAANCALAGAPSPETHPCGVCASCRAILLGNHPDVMWLKPDPTKAGGQIAVEDVREVIRKTGYHRYLGRARFVLVKPAEAMADAAANALLKTLEEPPAGTFFVLVTATSGALLPTIRSRCQSVRLGPVPAADIERWLVRRGISAADVLARQCDGRPGDAMDPALSGLRVAARDEVMRLVGADTPTRLSWSGKALAGGRAEWTPMVERLLDAVDDLLRDVTIVGAAAAVDLVNVDRADRVAELARRMWPGGVTRAAAAVTTCRDQLAVFVQGKAALDSLFATLAEEAGPSASG